MEAKFVFTFINFFVMFILALSAYVLSRRYNKLSKFGAKIFFWEALLALGYVVVSYLYLSTVYSQAEYFWYGTYLLYPITLVFIILFILYLFTKTFESLGYDKKIGKIFDDEEK